MHWQPLPISEAVTTELVRVIPSSRSGQPFSKFQTYSALVAWFCSLPPDAWRAIVIEHSLRRNHNEASPPLRKN